MDKIGLLNHDFYVAVFAQCLSFTPASTGRRVSAKIQPSSHPCNLLPACMLAALVAYIIVQVQLRISRQRPVGSPIQKKRQNDQNAERDNLQSHQKESGVHKHIFAV